MHGQHLSVMKVAIDPCPPTRHTFFLSNPSIYFAPLYVRLFAPVTDSPLSELPAYTGGGRHIKRKAMGVNVDLKALL